MLYLLSTSCVLILAYSTLFPLGDTLLLLSSCQREGVCSALPGLRGLLGVSSPSRRPCGAQLPRGFVFVLRFRCIRHFVINVINNICIRFIISFYVICAVIYCSFCCIYVWLDPGKYMIARFMFFYEPGVTGPMQCWLLALVGHLSFILDMCRVLIHRNIVSWIKPHHYAAKLAQNHLHTF